MANNILEYIKENIDKINEFQQDGVEWVDYYKKTLDSEETKRNNDFVNAIKAIKKSLPTKNQKLNRIIVKNLYSDIYTGFIATLLWGHIFPVHLQTIISTPKSMILSKLKEMFAGFKKDSSEQVFKMMMKGGEYHIDGIGVSFFTKIFYFTSHIHGYKNFLILDGKMWDVYNAFLKANGKNVKNYKVSNCQYEDYLQYCDYMRRNPYVKSPEKLEAFLFSHNNEIKTFLGLGNTHTKKEQSVKNPKPTKRNKKDNVSDYWSPFATFSSINHAYHNGLTISVPGYCIPLNGEQYRIFVAKWERKSSQKILVDYICKLMYEWGTDHNIDIDDNPDAVQIFNTHTNVRWGKNNDIKSYKYVKFGEDKGTAIEFMNQIIKEVKNLH